MRVFYLLIFFVLVHAQAQAQTQRKYEPVPFTSMRGLDYTARPSYDRLANQILSGAGDFDCGSLRARYAMIDAYDPIGDRAKKEILDRAYIIQNTKDPAALEKAKEEYGALARTHLGNIGAAAQLLSLALQDRRLGDPKIYRRVRDGLFRSVMDSGDGRSLESAYDVIVLDEETMLLKALDVEVLKTDMHESGGTYYNMHSVIDRKTGAPYTLFVNVTFPMEFLEEQRRAQGRVLNLPRQ